jgi:protein TonB
VTTEPLKPWVRRGLFAAVVFFHVGGGWALTHIHPAPIVAGETAPMEVSFVTEQPPQPQPEPPALEPVTPPELAQPEPPAPELAPQLESMVQPPEPDLPPPVFPVPPPPKPVAKPKPPPPRPHPQPQQAAPPPTAPAAPAPPAAPRTVAASQVGYLTRPAPIYPTRSRRAGEQGTVFVKVLVDATGRPAQVSLEKSSGHPALDESAVSAIKAARFRPYTEGGMPQPVWVVCPINFALQ